jgi:TonB family protein
MAENPTPEYPGGMKAMICFFEENLVYPSDSVQGRVAISAIVDTSGRVQQVKIRKSLGPLADAEVIRVVKLMIFKPALLNGKPVKSSIALPVSFHLGRKD